MSGAWPAFVEWASMGRYGWYVWSSYLFCFVVLGALAADTRRRKRVALRKIREERK